MQIGTESLLLRTILILIIPLVPISHSAYAFEFDDYINKGVDWFESFSRSSVNQTDIDPQYKDKIDDVIEEGVPVAKKGIDFWLALHHFIVSTLLNNSPINLGVGIATIISLGLVGFAIWHFLKKLGKFIVIVGLIVVGVVLLITVLGIQW